MTRLPVARTRAMRIVAMALAAGIAVPAAAAQTAAVVEKDPKIVKHPKRVSYRGTARIAGRMEGGVPGDKVVLEKRKPRGNWFVAADRRLDEDGKVRFVQKNLNRTKQFRLVHVDEGTEARWTSDPVKVRVRPKLTMHLKPRHVMAGAHTTVKGRLLPRDGSRKVVVLRKVDGKWKVIERTRVRSGRYATSIKGRTPSRRRIKVVFPGDVDNLRSKRKRTLKIYDPDLATWYGPGLYGNGTACGQRLERGTLGVAHRTLPCGTMVSIVYNGRSITVPVIDRGPFTDAEWDLTQETAERIGFSGTDTIGTLHE